MLVPYIKTGISVNTTPDISKSTIFTTLQTQNIQSADLVITQNLLDECEYKLVWKVEYYKDSSKISWIDAHTGSILKTVDFEDNLNASTVTYSSQNLIDHSITSGGTTTTTLESPDQRISLFNFNTSCPKDPLDVTEWNTNLIPVTHSDHWGTEAAAEVYQAFFVISSVIPVYDGLGINFVKVNIGSCTGKNAASLIGSTTEETFIKIARINGTTAALHDAIAHELAHTYLHKFIDSDEPGNGSLHEGISDMLGTYVESVIQGNVDWVMGDDESVVANAVGRDLEHPGSQADCYLEVSSSEKHTRCKPLGFWYFLISQGGQNIPALGREKALNIVLDALSFLEMNADYHNLMQATINVAIDAYGPCSNEVLSITNAWETICVDTDWPKVNGVVTGCDYTIAGPSYVCEEDDGAEFCLSGGVPNVKYRFTIIGKKSTEYSSVCGMVGNSQEGDCECLNLTDFPDYPYYPQYITIELYCPWIGSHYIQRKRIKLVDCDNDDPSCEDYYNLNNLVNNKNEFKPISENLNDLLKPFHSSNKQLDQISENLKLRVVAFDLLGRTIYDGNAAEMRNNLKSYQGFLILVSYDEKGHIVKTMKTIFIN